MKLKVLPALAAVSILAVAACKKAETPQPPPPSVPVAQIVEKEVVDWDEYPGRLESPQIANISPRVSGIIMTAPFSEGALVKEGDVLFVIDERPFKADYASKMADIGRAEAQLAQADAHFKRFDKLQGTRAISAEDYDESVAALKQAKANVGVANAALEISKLNLEWSKVTAPISGRISRKNVTEGNLVNTSARLTSITSVDPLYCYVTVPERTLAKYLSLIASDPSHAPLPCSVQLENENSFQHECTINFIDNQVDPTTGTISMRGVIPNADGTLTSGLFARLRVRAGNPYKALLVPDAALGTDQSNRIVYVVGENNIIEARPVKIGPLFGKMRSIQEGLKPGERVVVSGVQLVKNGAPVTPKEPPPELAATPVSALPVSGQNAAGAAAK